MINKLLNFSSFKNIHKGKVENEKKEEEKITSEIVIENVKKRNPNLDKHEEEDLKDLINTVLKSGGIISKEGIVTCYYALSKYNKTSYEKEGTVGAGSDKVMFSSTNNKGLKKFGEEILKLNIPIEKLFLSAITKEGILFKIPFRTFSRKMNIKQYEVA